MGGGKVGLREQVTEIWGYLSLKMIRAGVSDPKLEDHGCWARTPEVPFLGQDLGSMSFS